MTGILIDTNILVYLHDRSEFKKQGQALQILDHLLLTGAGRFSVQTLGEFFSATTRGSRPLLTVAQALKQVQELTASFPIFELTAQVVLEAARGVSAYQFAYWDAQLWAIARLNQVPVIFSEDFNIGSSLEGVRFVNPFAENFVVENWL